MEKEINFGIGFVTGRSNVCKVINSYYEQIVEQTKRYSKKINVTVFILFDTTYQQTPREEFYNIKPEVHKKIKIVLHYVQNYHIIPMLMSRRSARLLKHRKALS